MENLYLILAISIAGPVIGSLIGIIRRPSTQFMYNMLSFAAGVMLAISFLQLIPTSISLSSTWLSIFGIIIGALVMFIFDKLVPHIHPEMNAQEQGSHLRKTALYLLLGISLHNFPEGMAIAIGEVTGFKTMLAVAIAIAVHDIPEGICTSAPYYLLTKKRLKSFLLSAATVIPTILGFFFAHALFKSISHTIVGIILAATAGIMIYISADELIPTACNKNDKVWSHSTIFALIIGVIFVVILNSL